MKFDTEFTKIFEPSKTMSEDEIRELKEIQEKFFKILIEREVEAFENVIKELKLAIIDFCPLNVNSSDAIRFLTHALDEIKKSLQE